MQLKHLRAIPAGAAIPAYTPHAVSVCLPTIADVIRYRENQRSGLGDMQQGYPRNSIHPFESLAISYIAQKMGIGSGSQIILLPSYRSATDLLSHFNLTCQIKRCDTFHYIVLNADFKNGEEIKKYIRRTGKKVYSRQLEDFLVGVGILDEAFHEEVVEDEPEKQIRKTLAGLYETDESNISLYSSGMNAIYSSYQAINSLFSATKRETFIYFGQLYIDTMDIISSYSRSSIAVESINDFKWLEEILQAKRETIAAIFTEVPTNPYVTTPDLPRLYHLAQKYCIPLVVDTTMGTPVNLRIIPYCDIAVESLTKFAAGTGEVMGGAAILNPNSPFFLLLKKCMPTFGESIYIREAQRLAHTIKGYELRVTWSRNNVPLLVDFLQSHPKVKRVYWSHSSENIGAYKKIEKQPKSYALTVTVVFNCELSTIYDKLQLPKGPSFGADFTLVMPYVHLLYYDLFKTAKGQSILKMRGIEQNMIRISLGCEPVEQVIGAFAAALSS